MTVAGLMFIGGADVRGESEAFRAPGASAGTVLEPPFGTASAEQLDMACALAEDAFELFSRATPVTRAALLDDIAANILAIGDVLIERTMAESGLPRGRVEGERMRTVNQLRAFAAMLRAGDAAGVRIDPADSSRQPAPKPDLRLYKVALGPVAVFSASNFPLAFSVAGGDTAAALAAGCPVIVKAHSAHPGTSELIGSAIRDAVASNFLPAGVFAMLFGKGTSTGQALVGDHRIKAVGFTGSRRGGTALMEVAARRPEPIPVYAEMSSINPVILMPARLEREAEQIGAAFISALTLGAGQFCTNPGLIIALDSPGLARFLEAASAQLSQTQAANMLTPHILAAYEDGVSRLEEHVQVETIARGMPAKACGQAALFTTTADAFLANEDLQDEVFGAASLVVRCTSLDELHQVLKAIEGQLTIAVHMDPADHHAVAGLLPTLERKAGRLIANGFGTGVEVSPAMVHGGPFPSTSDGRSTSVGTLAIERFQRAVCYQDIPDDLLPASLQAANPLQLTRQTF